MQRTEIGQHINNRPELRKGDKGKDVREWKGGLCVLDYLDKGDVNDEFDPFTASVTEVFQAMTMANTETEERATAQEPMEGLQNRLHKIQELIESGALKTESDESICRFCYGTGMEYVEGKGARKCRCRRAALVAERLSKIPPRYAGVSVDSLSARVDLHPKQRSAIELIRNNPTDSFVICGTYGTGKTHLLWALYSAAAHDLQRQLVACTMLELIEQYYEAFRPNRDPEKEQKDVLVRPNDLMQRRIPYSLFFDDIDKPKITEYVAAQTHALFDAAYNNKHQIVVTTNLTPDDLKKHFEKADERYGGAIVRRIVNDDNNLIQMF